MFDLLDLPFVQRGLLEVALLSVGAGVVGTWIVLRGLAFFSHAVGTAAFPGLVLADGLGFAATLGAAGTGALVAVGVGVSARRPAARERYDASTALVLVGALALGIILASDVFQSGARVEGLLFGSLLLVDDGDLVLAACASVGAVVLSRVLEARWLLTGFDPGAAPSLGVRSALPDVLLLTTVAGMAVACLTTLGALLATALLVVPAATTRLLVTRLRAWQLASVGLVAAEGSVGLYLSVELNAPPGATIAVLSAGLFALVALGRALGRRRSVALVAVGAAALAAGGCGGDDGGADDGRVRVVATTTVAADLVRAVGGDRVDVTGLLAPNTDPHDYEPRPDDIRRTSGADLVVRSGDDLDGWMEDVVAQARPDGDDIDLSARLPVRRKGEEGSQFDPHWWHDPRNVEVAVADIATALTDRRPDARAFWADSAAAYIRRLRALDRGIARCIDAIAPAERKLVTDHDAIGYFADRYGLRVVGTVIPAQTTRAQASAGDVARLTQVVEREGVRAIFPEAAVPAKLAEAIARQTGATAELELYGDTLGEAGSSGATYLQLEAANADAIVRGLTGGRQRCRIAGLGG